MAIKLLPESFAGDRNRVARFDRDDKVLVVLNHPNIAALYRIEKAGDTLGKRLKHEVVIFEVMCFSL